MTLANLKTTHDKLAQALAAALETAVGAVGASAQVAAQARTLGLCVALSGGRDSVTLLHYAHHFAQQHRLPLRAIHVHHGLHPAAAEWAQQCRALCLALSTATPLQIFSVALQDGPNLEARARAARYGVFERSLRRGEILLTAHHADDQLETLLMRLLRGSGAQGMQGIAANRSLGAGQVLRPWLSCPQALIIEAAEREQWSWVEDPSNADPRFDRNFLRQQVLPLLRQRWPQAARSAARCAQHLSQSIAANHTAYMVDAEPASASATTHLSLETLDPSTATQQLHAWIVRQGLYAPPARRLSQWARELVGLRADAQWRGDCGAVTFAVYRGQLYVVERPPSATSPTASHCSELIWSGRYCDWAGQSLTRDWLRAQGLQIDDHTALRVRGRRGGEALQVRGQHRALKKLWQQYGVPPWRRDSVPLVWRDSELVAVYGYAVKSEDVR